MAIVKINVPEVIGTPICVAASHGQKVHDLIAVNLRSGNSVQISFLGVQRLITAFLNTAIGQLYGEFKEEEIRSKLSVVDAPPEIVEKVVRVVEAAKLYFKDPTRFEAASQKHMGGDEHGPA